MNKKELILELFKIGAIKFGQFKLKSGIISPIYIDLRILVSFPRLLKKIARAIEALGQNLKFDLVVGVPYTALPLATVISTRKNIPMLMRRKEIKNYGTKKIIEGIFKKGQKVLIIEDLVTSGSSILETVEPLKKEGLIIKEAIVLLDREQGGKINLKKQGVNLYSLIQMSEMLDLLVEEKKITREIKTRVQKFIKENQLKI